MKAKYRNIVIFSGGLDSSVVAAMLEPEDTLLVHVNQGFVKHENQALEMSDHLEMDMEIFDHSATIDKLRIPGMGYIPGYRAFNMLSALAAADKYDAPFIYSGEVLSPFYSNDQLNDPDYIAFKQMLGLDAYDGESLKVNRDALAAWYGKSMFGKPETFQFIDPLWGMTKANIIKLGEKLDVPFYLSVSCRSPDLDRLPDDCHHCGTCGPCVARRAGFYLAEVEDDTVYKSKPQLPEQYLKKGQ